VANNCDLSENNDGQRRDQVPDFKQRFVVVASPSPLERLTLLKEGWLWFGGVRNCHAKSSLLQGTASVEGVV
jgi:hypothetical protein